MACHILFLDFEKTDYDISDEFLAAGYGEKEIIKNFWNSNSSNSSLDQSLIDTSSLDPSSVDPSLIDLMITNFKLLNITNELIIAYNPTSSACKGDSGQFDKLNLLIYAKYIYYIILLLYRWPFDVFYQE